MSKTISAFDYKIKKSLHKKQYHNCGILFYKIVFDSQHNRQKNEAEPIIFWVSLIEKRGSIKIVATI